MNGPKRLSTEDFDRLLENLAEPDIFVTPGDIMPGGDLPGIIHFSIPMKQIPELVTKYCAALETGKTLDWCNCEWAVHPHDIDIEEGVCRTCGAIESSHGNFIAGELPLGHYYKSRRMRLKEVNPQCPVHTKEGLILGFYNWVFQPPKQEGNTDENRD